MGDSFHHLPATPSDCVVAGIPFDVSTIYKEPSRIPWRPSSLVYGTAGV